VDLGLCTEKKLSILLFCLFILSSVKHKSKQSNASTKLCNRNQEKMAEQQKGKALGESETGGNLRDCAVGQERKGTGGRPWKQLAVAAPGGVAGRGMAGGGRRVTGRGRLGGVRQVAG
jgi:hypothetical protein